MKKDFPPSYSALKLKLPLIMHNLELTLLSIILALLSYFSCFYALGKDSLWLDEGYTFFAIENKTSSEVFSHVIEKEQSPPLFFVLTAFTFPFLENEASLRLVSATSIFLTGIFLFLLGSKIFGAKTSFFSAVFFTLHPLCIASARDARMYALLALFCTASALYLYLALDKDKFRHWFLFVVSSSLALWTHFLAGVFLFCLGIFFLISRFSRDKERFKKFLWSCLSILFLFSPWLAVFIKKQFSGIAGSRSWALSPNIKDLGNIFSNIFLENYFLTLLFFALLFLQIFFLRKKKDSPEREKFLFLIFSSLAPIILAFLISQKISIFQKRYFIFSIPFFAISFFSCLNNFFILISGKLKKSFLGAKIKHSTFKFSSLKESSSRDSDFIKQPLLKARVLMEIFLVLILVVTFVTRANLKEQLNSWIDRQKVVREDWREVSEYLKELKPNKIIVHTPSIALPLGFYRVENIKTFPDSLNFRGYTVYESMKKEFKSELKEDLIFIKGLKPYIHEEREGILEGWIREFCEEKSRKEFKKAELLELQCF